MAKLTYMPERRIPKLVSLADVVPQEINWLWYPYIPKGTVTAFYGRGGMGKSFITCDLASRLSNGMPLPDQETPMIPQKVLMLSAEDDYSKVLVPRLMASGANLHNIAVPDFQFTLDDWGGGQVKELMREFAATVVFIDPIVYYAGGKMDMNKSNEVRAMMERLKTAAEQAESSVIIVGHIKKSQEGEDGDQMMGSADWINAARSALFVTTTNDGTRVLKHSKSNYGPRGPARSYTISDNGVFEWGEVYDHLDIASKSPNAADLAVAFLKTLLGDGPVPAVHVMERAKENNISTSTLNRAKPGIAESYFNRSAGCFYWRLVNEG